MCKPAGHWFLEWGGGADGVHSPGALCRPSLYLGHQILPLLWWPRAGLQQAEAIRAEHRCGRL